MIVKILFTDNLISRNRARWSSKEIKRMPNLIVGKHGKLDHNWEYVGDRWGVVISAKAVKSEPPDNLSPEEAEIVGKDNYWYGECDLEIPDIASNVDIRDMVQSLLLSEVSIGFSYKTMRCPDCTCKAKDLRSPECPATWDDTSYYERIDIQEIYEISFVEIPDVRRARILLIDGFTPEKYQSNKNLHE